MQMVCARLDAIDASLVADAPLLALLLGVSLEPEQLPVLTPGVQRRRLQHACLQVLLQQAVDAPCGTNPSCLDSHADRG
jgi:hypothetical protein